MADDTERTKRPIWLPDTQGFLAVAIIALIAIIVLVLLVRPPAIDERTSGVLMTIVGVLIACLKDVYSFFFGSSKGSQEKDGTQAKIVEKLTSTNPPGVPGPVAPVLLPPPAWWTLLTDAERFAIEADAPNNSRLTAFIAAAKAGKATSDELTYLVQRGLLTPTRADAIAASV